MNDSTFMTLMKLLPKSALSTVVGRATRAPLPASVHRAIISAFAKRYRVSVEEAEHELAQYPTFGEFFTRKLKEGSRPIDLGADVIVSPVDGAVSQAGYLEGDQLLQAKGVSYPVGKLLADEASAHAFAGGAFATLYLSPRDYHRIHAPLAGRILGYSYVPGEFWPVNPASVKLKKSLFCINERLITFMQTPAGLMALVAVGATCVSRIRATYEPDFFTHGGGAAKIHRYERPIELKKGDEVGLFEMGSTVILLFERGKVQWDAALTAESVVRMGKRIGEVLT